MTSEEHQSILKVAVSYAIEETKRICFQEMDKAMAELTEAHVASAKDAIQRARAEQAAELAKYKALAETLAGAVDVMQSYGCPVCNGDCGSANPPVIFCPMTQCAEALRQYKEARDV